MRLLRSALLLYVALVAIGMALPTPTAPPAAPTARPVSITGPATANRDGINVRPAVAP